MTLSTSKAKILAFWVFLFFICICIAYLFLRERYDGTRPAITNQLVNSNNTVIYSNSNFSLRYPSGWKLSSVQTGTGETVFLASGDFIPPQTAMDSKPTNGYQLSILVTNNTNGDSFVSELKQLEVAQSSIGGTYRLSMIDGHRAVVSDIHSEGIFLWAKTFKNGKIYYFEFEERDDKDPVAMERFLSLLSSVHLKG